MSGGGRTFDRKQAYCTKLIELLREHSTIIIVGADHVGSHHLQRIRMALRGKAELLMGKNTMMRKMLRGYAQDCPALEAILPYIRENIGFVFVKAGSDLTTIKRILTETTVGLPAKMGAIAPCDVVIPTGPTGLDPTHTGFCQALSIPTKINRGQIEVIQDVNLIRSGEKVGASQSALLAKLNIRPFRYGLKILQIYDESGHVIPNFDIDATILDVFGVGLRNVAAASLGLGIPTHAAVPYYLLTAYKNVASVALGIPGYEIDLMIKPMASQGTTSAPALVIEDEPPEEDEEEEFQCWSFVFEGTSSYSSPW